MESLGNSFISDNRNIDYFEFAAGHLKFRPQLMGYRGHPMIWRSRISTAVSEKYSSWLHGIAKTLQWEIVILRIPHNYGRKTFLSRCDSRTLNINSPSRMLKKIQGNLSGKPTQSKIRNVLR